MDQLKVHYLGGMGFEVRARQHALTIDLIKEKGGKDLGMNPPEVFMASLGSCIGVHVVRYCQNAELNAEGMSIALDWKISDDKTKISDINVHILLPGEKLGKREKALLEVARHCLIHNTILGQPQIHIALRET